MNASYYQKDKPNSLFNSFAPFWHLWTPENHEIVFPDEKSFRAGMGLVGICARQSKDVQVVTFELMSNHVHFVLSGTEEAAKEFFQMFRDHLSRFFKRQGEARNLKGFDCSLRQVETLDDLRNVIAYTNRNGFLVNPAETPFNYPWGANGYYFNRHAKMRFRESTKTMTFKERRDLAQSRQAESVNEGLTMVDGCLCPLTYCKIELWEGLFWDAHQYVSRVFKNIEAQKKIAEEVGESCRR